MPEELPEKTEGPVPGRQTLEEAVSEELVQTLLEQNAALQEQLQRMMAERDAKEEKGKRRKTETGRKCITMVGSYGIGGEAGADDATEAEDAKCRG